MARANKDCADYFPHYAHEGKTLFILETKYGNDGYALWFKLLELLCRTEGHYLDCRDECDWLFLCGKAHLDEITVTEIIDLLVKLGQVDAELWKNRLIWVQGLVDNLKNVYDKRKRELPQKPIIRDETLPVVDFCAGNASADAFSVQPVPEMRQSKVEYSIHTDDDDNIDARAREDGSGASDESDHAFVDLESDEDGFGDPDADWVLDDGVDRSPAALLAVKNQIAAAFRGVFGYEASPAALQSYVTWYTLGNPLALICEALRRAAAANARAPNGYAAQCLRRWRSRRIVCMDGVIQADFDHEEIMHRGIPR